jgi:predicted dehydrogenase
MELDGGITANLVASFEAVDQYICDLEIHGTEGVLALPDPNAFEGPVRVKAGRETWREAPYPAAGGRDSRSIGLHDLVEAITAGTSHRASAELGLHVVEVARGILRSAAEGSVVAIESHPRRPAPRPAPQAVG